MKTMKKIASVALALVMALCLAVPAFAADIKITNKANEGTDNNETYVAYKVFDVVIGEGGENAPHSYTIKNNSPFYNVIKDFKITVPDTAEGAEEGATKEINAFTLEEVGDISNVTFNGDYNDAAFAANLATALNAVANKASEEIARTNTQVNGVYTLTIPETEQGYYFITSTLGSKIIVDTVGKNTVEVTSKNEYPTLEKKILETGIGVNNEEVTNKVDTTTASYGGTVTFELAVTIPATAVGPMTVHDTMSSHLRYTGWTEMTGVTATVATTEAPIADGCTVEFLISDTLVAEKLGETIYIQYTATLNPGAPIATEIPNTAHLTYSEYKTPDDTVNVYTYQFDLFKTNSKNEPLKDATFTMGMPLVDLGNNTYRVAVTGDETTVTEFTTDETGKILIQGLKNGTYTLTEVNAPEGYNKLKDPVTVTINNANNMVTETLDANNHFVGGIHVINLTGAELPSTGGIGTTLFYIGGGILVVAAGVLLVTKKRMGAEE